MHRLTVLQTAEMQQLWTDLSMAYPTIAPPETDGEVVAALLDAWIAGVVSSQDSFTSNSLDELVDLLEERPSAEDAKPFVDRLLTLARSASENDH